MSAFKVKEIKKYYLENGSVQAGLEVHSRCGEWIVVPDRADNSFVQQDAEYATLRLSCWREISESAPGYFLSGTRQNPKGTYVHPSHKRKKKRQPHKKPKRAYVRRKHFGKLQLCATLKKAGCRRKRRPKKMFRVDECRCTCAQHQSKYHKYVDLK